MLRMGGGGAASGTVFHMDLWLHYSLPGLMESWVARDNSFLSYTLSSAFARDAMCVVCTHAAHGFSVTKSRARGN